jgi:hypothetical protein
MQISSAPPHWRRRLAQGNSFVTKVSAGPKIFILGDEDDLRRIHQ